MSKSVNTKEKLLLQARAHFWTRGYSNVALREIATAAGVDVALISRYFGGKLGLFEATLEGAFDWEANFGGLDDSVLDKVAEAMAVPIEQAVGGDALTLLVMNGNDPEVGDLLMAQFLERGLTPLKDYLGGESQRANAALFMAVLLGIKMARKTLKLPGLVDADHDALVGLNRYLIEAALAYGAER